MGSRSSHHAQEGFPAGSPANIMAGLHGPEINCWSLTWHQETKRLRLLTWPLQGSFVPANLDAVRTVLLKTAGSTKGAKQLAAFSLWDLQGHREQIKTLRRVQQRLEQKLAKNNEQRKLTKERYPKYLSSIYPVQPPTLPPPRVDVLDHLAQPPWPTATPDPMAVIASVPPAIEPVHIGSSHSVPTTIEPVPLDLMTSASPPLVEVTVEYRPSAASALEEPASSGTAPHDDLTTILVPSSRQGIALRRIQRHMPCLRETDGSGAAPLRVVDYPELNEDVQRAKKFVARLQGVKKVTVTDLLHFIEQKGTDCLDRDNGLDDEMDSMAVSVAASSVANQSLPTRDDTDLFAPALREILTNAALPAAPPQCQATVESWSPHPAPPMRYPSLRRDQCAYCRGYGHWLRDCPIRPPRPQRYAAPAPHQGLGPVSPQDYGQISKQAYVSAPSQACGTVPQPVPVPASPQRSAPQWRVAPAPNCYGKMVVPFQLPQDSFSQRLARSGHNMPWPYETSQPPTQLRKNSATALAPQQNLTCTLVADGGPGPTFHFD